MFYLMFYIIALKAIVQMISLKKFKS